MAAAKDLIHAGVKRAIELEIVPQKEFRLEIPLWLGGGIGGLQRWILPIRIYWHLVEREGTLAGIWHGLIGFSQRRYSI